VNRIDPRGTCDISISGWIPGDPGFPFTTCDASLGSNINPAALTECFTVNTCLANYQAALGGSGYPEGAAGVVTASNVSSSGVNEAKIERLMTDLEDNIDPDCAGWLLGNPAFQGTTIRSMTTDAINNSSVGHGTLTNANPNLVTNAVTNLPNNLNLAIIINDHCCPAKVFSERRNRPASVS
jgi:hypothetical protein